MVKKWVEICIAHVSHPMIFTFKYRVYFPPIFVYVHGHYLSWFYDIDCKHKVWIILVAFFLFKKYDFYDSKDAEVKRAYT